MTKKIIIPTVSEINIVKLLEAFGIKEKAKAKCRNKAYLHLISIFHHFSLFLHFATVYNITILCRFFFEINSKSVYASLFNSILSLIIWHVTRARSTALLGTIKDYKKDFLYFERIVRTKRVIQKRAILLMLFGCLLMLLLLSLYMSVCFNLPHSFQLRFWFMNYPINELNWLTRLLIAICILVYIGQQILFPTVFLIFFCMSTLELAESLERMKAALKTNRIWKYPLALQSRTHKKLLEQVNKHDGMLSFPIFLLVILSIDVGFTGLALEMNYDFETHFFNIYEGMLYLYFCLVAVVSVTYSASSIPNELTEIREMYRNAFDSVVEGMKEPFTLKDEKKLKLLKTISQREIIHLTAWGVIRLDKNFAFSVFGTLFTYGFLILQLKKDESLY